MNISISMEFGVKWRGKYLRPSKHAIRELIKIGLDLTDVVYILDKGYEYKSRAKDTVERCLKRGRRILKVVIVKSYAYDIEDEVWLVKHVGGK